MVTITKQFDFKAEDFFDYLDKQLIQSIKKARGDQLPIKLISGIRYKQGDIDTVITNYQRGEKYAAEFKNMKMDVTISYVTKNVKDGVEITFTEDIKNYDPATHSKFNNLLYNLQLKHGAKKELRQMAAAVRDHMHK